MRRTVIIARLLGIAITSIGAALTYNMWAPPMNRLGGRQFDVVMLFGPALALLGVVVFFDFLSFASSTRRTRTPAELLTSIFLPLGLMFVLVSVALLVVAWLMNSESAGVLGTMSVFVLGLPGMALIGIGLVRRMHQ